MQKIERIKPHSVVPLRLEILLKQRKTGNAVLAFRHQFAVDQRGVGWKLLDRGGDGREFHRPVETFARLERDLAAVEPRLQAIAVELDLVNPVAGAWRLVRQGREARFDEIGEGGAFAID